MTPLEQLSMLREAWECGDLTFPRLVLELETLVTAARADIGEAAGTAAFHAWGQLEIINALTLDGGIPLSPDDRQDAAAELDRLRDALFGAFRE